MPLATRDSHFDRIEGLTDIKWRVQASQLGWETVITGKAPRARYVRLERQSPADVSKLPGRFHLRNFLVYGRKLY